MQWPLYRPYTAKRLCQTSFLSSACHFSSRSKFPNSILESHSGWHKLLKKALKLPKNFSFFFFGLTCLSLKLEMSAVSLLFFVSCLFTFFQLIVSSLFTFFSAACSYLFTFCQLIVSCLFTFFVSWSTSKYRSLMLTLMQKSNVDEHTLPKV